MILERTVQNLFDYAGMFPPASLSFPEALRESARLRDTLRRPHLVSAHMVVKPEHLPLLDDDTLIKAGFEGQNLKICLVGVHRRDADDALDRIRSFHDGARGTKIARRIVALEIADDNDLLDDLEAIINDLRRINLRATGYGLALYHEPRWEDPAWEDGLDRVLTLLRETAGEGRPHVGLKVRCAGPTALTPRTLAVVTATAVDAKLPLKVTQGLHHPLVEPERYDAPIGFLGLVVAHRLRAALGEGFPVPDMRDCLTWTDKDDYGFNAGLRFRDHHATGDALDRAFAVPLNIGSCSLAEPDEDLERLFGPPPPR